METSGNVTVEKVRLALTEAITERAYARCFHVSERSNRSSPQHQPSSALPVGKFRSCLGLVCAEIYCAVDIEGTPMIIDQESHVRKTQLDPEHDAPAPTSRTPLIPAESPPAYTPREGPVASSSHIHPYHNPQPTPPTQKRPPNRAAQRFLSALAVAFALYVAIACFCRFLFFVIGGPPPPHEVCWTRTHPTRFRLVMSC
jgi:hypothetical protein